MLAGKWRCKVERCVQNYHMWNCPFHVLDEVFLVIPEKKDISWKLYLYRLSRSVLSRCHCINELFNVVPQFFFPLPPHFPALSQFIRLFSTINVVYVDYKVKPNSSNTSVCEIHEHRTIIPQRRQLSKIMTNVCRWAF